MKAWIDTANDGEASARSREFWSGMRADLDAGAFWADRIKSFRHYAQARLQLALHNLPLPAAFREAAVALRSLIRTKRKGKQAFEEELAFLYWLAAVESFGVPYSARLREPGFNVIESIPGAVIRNLSFEYARLGYERLALLNATDRKWIVESWGEGALHVERNPLVGLARLRGEAAAHTRSLIYGTSRLRYHPLVGRSRRRECQGLPETNRSTVSSSTLPPPVTSTATPTLLNASAT